MTTRARAWWPKIPLPAGLVVLLAALAVALTVTAVPGVFILDEDHYLVTVIALRHDAVTVPETAGLPASRELLWFDPVPRARVVHSTPVSATAPPIYAFLAYPFALFGWRGLVALDAIAFAVTAALVFALARRRAETRAGPFVAVAVYVLGGYTIEYAQGVWPHCLATMLVVAAVYLGLVASDGSDPSHADRPRAPLVAVAGLLAGLAAGVRYQDAALALALGAALVALARGPLRARATLVAGYGLGLAAPLAACSSINHARLGSWSPLSKGPHYLSLDDARAQGGLVADAARSLYANVVDYSTHPAFSRTEGHEIGLALPKDPTTGAILVAGVVKKAWVQSCPWIAVALLVLALHLARRRGDRDIRALAALVFCMLAVFAAYGFRRTDSWCMNQRYYLELVPFAAIAFARAVEPALRGRAGWALAAVGAAIGLVLAAHVSGPEVAQSTLDQLGVLYLPLAIAVVAVAAFVAWRTLARVARLSLAVALAAGVTLGWSFGEHVLDDLRASRGVRRDREEQTRSLDASLPARGASAVFTYWGGKDAFGPLLFTRDLVLADTWIDHGVDAVGLRDALLARGRRVFVPRRRVPAELVEALVRDHRVVPVPAPNEEDLVEIMP